MTGWRIDAADAVVRAPLDLLTAVFHPRSGQTHLLSDPSPAILDAIAAGARDADAVLTAMGLSPDAEVRAGVTARVAELIETGLVTCATP